MPGSKIDKNELVICHAIALIGFIIPLGGVLGPLVYWLIKKDESPEIARHAVEALNFNITYSILVAVSALLTFVLVGFVLLPIVSVCYVVLLIVACVKVNDGEDYRYPYIFRFVG